MVQWFEIVILFLVIILGSLVTAWVYRRIMAGIPIRKEEREVIQVGKLAGYAREKKVRKR